MSRNTEKEWTKVSTQPQYNLYRSAADPRAFQVRLKASGGYLRRRFNAPDLASALDEAPRVAGLVRPEQARDAFTLAEAFAMALASTKRRDGSRKAWVKDTEKFLRWLAKRHPLCTRWGTMTRQILREYLATQDGKSDNHRRLMMQPLLQTAGFMHREYGHPNIGERMGIGAKLKTPPKTVYLEDALAFCDWLRENRPHLEAGACLQGLAGLQLQESLRVTWDKVDLKRGLVEISGEVKNDYRNRVIPVCARVLEGLVRSRTRLSKGKVREIQDSVVTGVHGAAFEDFRSYGRQLAAAIRAWNAECGWAPKDLRNCLPTFATMEGIHGTVWEQYIGHAPKTVTERHYVPRLASRTMGEKKALERQVALFRRLVTDPLDKFAAGPTCSILQLGASGEKDEKRQAV